MRGLTSKNDVLQGLLEATENFKHLFKQSKDPFWEQAVTESILEYDLIKDIPDDEHFVINRAKLLLQSGLYHNAEKRLNRIAKKQRND